MVYEQLQSAYLECVRFWRVSSSPLVCRLSLTWLLQALSTGLDGMKVLNTSGHFFDTLTIDTGSAQKAAKVHAEAAKRAYNLRVVDEHTVGVTFDESVTEEELAGVASCFLAAGGQGPITVPDLVQYVKAGAVEESEGVLPSHARAAHSSTSELLQSVPSDLRRTSRILTQPVFNTHHSETELLRYIHALQEKDLSLAHAMIPLGSCTMKLNASAAMRPLTWPEFGGVHPFVSGGVKGWKVVIDVSLSILSRGRIANANGDGSVGTLSGLVHDYRICSVFVAAKLGSSGRVCRLERHPGLSC
jgi:hypothetical protein